MTCRSCQNASVALYERAGMHWVQCVNCEEPALLFDEQWRAIRNWRLRKAESEGERSPFLRLLS